MKLDEIMKTPDGTYAGVRYSQASRDAIKRYQKENNIPNPLDPSKLHSTLLYSTKHLPDYTAAGMYDPTLKAQPKTFEKWASQPDEDGKVSQCLVLTTDSPELVKRHEKLMDEHDAKYNFPEFKTHVTLSYDVGDDFDVDSLPPFEEELEITEEYQEDLDLSWAKTNSAKK